MYKTIIAILACTLAVPALALAQGANTDAVRPTQNAFEVRPFNFEEIRQAKEAILLDIKQRREELKNATATIDLPIFRASIMEARVELSKIHSDRREAALQALREKSVGLQDETAKRRAEALEKYVIRFGEVLEKRIERLVAIADRLEERILRLEDERGVDLSAASVALEEAYTLLEQAAQMAEEFSTKSSDAVEGETAAQSAQEMKTLRADVQLSIRTAHQKLTEAIVAVRAGLSATTTTSN